MRVLLDGLQAGNRSGTGRYALCLAEALAQLQADFELAVILPDDIAAAFNAPPDVQVFGRPAGAFRRLCFDQFGIEHLRDAIGAELVHYPANIGALIAHGPAVLTIHDCSYFRHPEWFRPERAAYYRFAVRRSAQRALRILADSQATANDVAQFCGVPETRIDVVPLGAGPEFTPASEESVARVRERYRLPRQFFLYTGTHEPRKNLPRLVEAWSRVAGSLPHDLVLAGRAGWKSAALEAAIAGSPHAARVHRPGFVPHADLPALLSAADAFVWPSLFEGFGLPPLEAMACGTPVLISNSSSLPEVVGDAAVCVDPEDTAAIAGGLQEVLAQAGELRGKGLARAAQFTWERTAKLALESYRRALGG